MLRALLKMIGLYGALLGVLDAATAASRWQTGAGGAQQRFVEGVQSTSKDPTALAAAQAQKMLNGVTQAVTSGYWQQRLADVGKTGWQQATVAKAANYGVGVQAAGSKYQQGYQQFWNYMTPYLNQVLSMPKNTLADSIARATAYIQASAGYRKS